MSWIRPTGNHSGTAEINSRKKKTRATQPAPCVALGYKDVLTHFHTSAFIDMFHEPKWFSMWRQASSLPTNHIPLSYRQDACPHDD